MKLARWHKPWLLLKIIKKTSRKVDWARGLKDSNIYNCFGEGFALARAD